MDSWLHAWNKCVVNMYAKVPHSVPESESATKEDRNVKVHEKNAKMRDPCHGYLMFLQWWSSKGWVVCASVMCMRNEMQYDSDTKSSESDIWSCSKATILVWCYKIKRNWFKLACTNKWQQSALSEGDDGDWEQKTSMCLLCLWGLIYLQLWHSLLLNNVQLSPILLPKQSCPNLQIGNKH